MHPFIVIIVIIVLALTFRYVINQPLEKRRHLMWRYTLYGLALLLVGLVVTGRMHWVAGAIGALLPIVQRLIPWLLRLLPFVMSKRQNTTSQQDQSAVAKTVMDKQQALKIFGFDKVPDKKVITQRHRELINKNHPDRGGSDFIAAQINEAKDVLLQYANK